MSAMDVPGICGYSCSEDTDCDGRRGSCDPTEVSALTRKASGSVSCTSVVRLRMVRQNVTCIAADVARFCDGGSPGGPQCDVLCDGLGEGCSDFGCYNDRVEGIESPAACEEYTAVEGKYYPAPLRCEMHRLEPGYIVMHRASLVSARAYGSPGCEDPQPPAGPGLHLTQASVTTLRVSSVWRLLLSVCRAAAIPASARQRVMSAKMACVSQDRMQRVSHRCVTQLKQVSVVMVQSA